MTKGVIGCVKEPVPGDTEPLGTDKKPENTVPNGSVSPGRFLLSGCRLLETLFVYRVYSSVNLLLTIAREYGFVGCNMIRLTNLERDKVLP